MKFAEPEETGGNRCYPKDVVNHLLLVWAIDYIEHSPTQFSRPDKPSDVIIVDVVDLDQVDEDTGQPGMVARKAWWRQARLIQSLKPNLKQADPMLVRMSKGLGSKGMNAPFELISQTGDPACVSRANAWFDRNPTFLPSVAGSYTPYLGPSNEDQGEAPQWATAREETVLERMARQATQQSPSLPPRRPDDMPF